MDHQRKLEFLVQCDFSEWRERERARKSGKNPSELHGFGQVIIGLAWAASNLGMDIATAEALDTLRLGLHTIATAYSTVPFSEMSPDDPDFKFLFDYKKRIDCLSLLVEKVASKTAEDTKNLPDCAEYKALKTTLQEMLKFNYRTQVLDKYGLTFVENTC